MPSYLSKLSRFNDALIRVTLAISALGLLAMTAITGWQVFGRYVLNDSPQWVERTTLLLVLYFTLLAGAVGVREESHLGISFISEALPVPVRKFLGVAIFAILAAFGGVLVWNGFLLVAETWDVATPIIRIPEGATYLAIPLGGLLIILFALELALRTIFNARTG